MQTVSGREIARGEFPATDRRRILGDRVDVTVDYPNAGVDGGFVQGLRQGGAPHADPLSGPKFGPDRVLCVQIGDAPKCLAARMNTEFFQVRDGVGHQTLAAGLVDRPGTPFHHDGLQPGLGGAGRGGESAGSAADDEQVDHDRLASAVFSVLIRVTNSAALSAVKTHAVIQAVCTSGSAMPSAITAT